MQLHVANNKFIITTIVLVVVLIILYLFAINYPFVQLVLQVVAFYILAFIFATILITAMLLFKKFKKVTKPHQLMAALMVSLMCFIGFLVFLWRQEISTAAFWVYALLFLCLITLSLIPLIGAPLAVSINRHR